MSKRKRRRRNAVLMPDGTPDREAPFWSMLPEGFFPLRDYCEDTDSPNRPVVREFNRMLEVAFESCYVRSGEFLVARYEDMAFSLDLDGGSWILEDRGRIDDEANGPTGRRSDVVSRGDLGSHGFPVASAIINGDQRRFEVKVARLLCDMIAWHLNGVVRVYPDSQFMLTIRVNGDTRAATNAG